MRVCACRRKRVYVVAAAAAANSLAFPTSCSFLWRGETLQSKEHPSVHPLACPPATDCQHSPPSHPSSSTQHPLQEGGTQHRHVCAPFPAGGELPTSSDDGGKTPLSCFHPSVHTTSCRFPSLLSLVLWFFLFPLVVVLLPSESIKDKVDTGWTLKSCVM